MNRLISTAAFVAASVGMASCATDTTMDRPRPTTVQATHEQSVRAMVNTWPETARKAAWEAMGKYGSPDGVTDTMLIWHDNGPWKRTIVYREEVDHRFPMPHKDVWEQFVNYDVPPEKFDEIAAYDGSVMIERTKGEISARCDKEAANFLALNLADDIINNRRTVDDARNFYAQTIKTMKEGGSSPYLEGLRFTPPARSGFADRPSPILASR
ncbi:MAG: hypothetical protein KY459_03705 [Acidobacteria bacterium]|nr:hypothetical protein [Acidobacteriota bacterium]